MVRSGYALKHPAVVFKAAFDVAAVGEHVSASRLFSAYSDITTQEHSVKLLDVSTDIGTSSEA